MQEYKLKKSEFVTSISDIKVYHAFSAGYDCPEICVVGRSNVGKSSFINMLAGKKTAKVSSTPGRTRLINLFSFNDDDFMLVDLPGYGYAQASKAEQAKWSGFIEDYLNESEKLIHIFSLVDIRHEPTAKDRQMVDYMYKCGLPFTVVATKADKLSRAETCRNVQKIASVLGLGKDDIIPVSSITRMNADRVATKIGSVLQGYAEREITEE